MFAQCPHTSPPAMHRQPTGPAKRIVRAADADLDQALEVFLANRTRLFRIAYRVVGDVSGAEDVMQDAWIRWQGTDRSQINNPAAFLTTATTRLAINVIQSAGRRHETPTESPLANLVNPVQDPVIQTERAAEIVDTLRMLSARLSPSKLAAYVLRKGFDYPYQAIAALLRTSVPNARQLVRRAQSQVADGPVSSVDDERHRVLVGAFLAAAHTGDMERLETVLAASACPTSSCSAQSERVNGKTRWPAAAGVPIRSLDCGVMRRPISIGTTLDRPGSSNDLTWVRSEA